MGFLKVVNGLGCCIEELGNEDDFVIIEDCVEECI